MDTILKIIASITVAGVIFTAMQAREKKLTINSKSPTKKDLEGTDYSVIYAPNAEVIEANAFTECKQLKSANLPKLKEI